MTISPLCGYSLQKGTLIFAITQIILAALYLLQNFVGFCYYVPQAIEENRTENTPITTGRVYTVKTAIIVLNTGYWTCSLFLGVVLYFGAKQRDLRKCRQWFILSCILLVLFLVDIMMQAFSMRATPAEMASPIIGSVLLSYMIWVVLAFIDEIRLGIVPIKCLQHETHE